MCYKSIVNLFGIFILIEKNVNKISDSYRFGSLSAPSKVSFSLSKLHIVDDKMIAMKYTTLLSVALNFVRNDSDSDAPEKTAANFASIVRSWLTFIGKDEYKHNVGAELNTSFETVLAEYLNDMVASGFSPNTIRDRKSAVRRLHTIYQTQLSIARNERSSELGVELRRILLKAELTGKDLARLAKVSPSFIQRVLSGVRPQKEAGLKNFRRIESVLLSLGVISSKGHFLDLLRLDTSEKSCDKKNSSLSSISVEEANKCYCRKSKSPLRLWSLEELKKNTPELNSFLERYVQHKNRERAWSLKRPSRKELAAPRLWAFKYNGKTVHSPTFERYLSDVVSILAFKSDYQDIPLSKLNDPCIFADKETYLSYIDFLAERRGGRIGKAGASVVTLAGEFAKEIARQEGDGTLPKLARPINVNDVVSSVKQYFKRFANSGRVRDPWKRAAPFLELDDPARPLAELSMQLQKGALIPHTFVSHAVDLRDSFLIALLLAVPLRERTCIQLTYKSDGTGHLRYSKKDQAWRIELPANQVKNQRIISRTLPVFLNASIERYLGEARPRLLNTWGSDAENIDFLFISSYRKCDSTKVIDELTGDLYELTQGQMSVSSRLGFITKKHLGLSVRAHAFRHITASRFLKLNPGQYQACADLLADSVETVMKHYAYHDASWNEKMLNDSISKAFACENN